MEAVIAFLYTVGDFIIATVAGAEAVGAVSALTSAAIGATAIIGGTVGLSKLFEIEMNVPDTDYSRQRTVKGGTQPVKTVYGEALVSGPIAFLGAGNSAVSSSGNQSLYHVIALTGHESESITDIYFDNVKIQSSDINGGAATGGAVGGSTVYGPVNSTTITYINKHLGADTSADSMVSAQFAKWTSDHVGQGVTYIATQFYFPDNSDIADVWNKHTPSDIKALVKGVKTIYDPRDDTGGNGAAPGNTSFQSWSDNPALCLADYMTNTEWGMGIPTSKVDWDAVADAADYCDELQSIPGSATQKRFTCNGVLFGTEAHQNNVSKLLSSMNGSMVYTGGKYVINAGQYIAPGVDDILTEDDLNGHVTLTTSTKRSDRFNTITGVFNDPDQLHKQVEFPKVQISSAVTRDNSEVLTKQIQLSMTNNVYMAQRLAYQMIKRSNDQMVLDFPANLKGLRVAIGDRVKVTINQFAGSEADPISFVNKVFVCTNFSFTDSNAGGVNLTLVEDTEANYYDATVTPALIMPVAAYSSVDLSDGSITDGFRGVPVPSSLSAVGVAQGIALTWTNPLDPLEFDNIKIYRVPGTASTFVAGDVDQTYYTKNNFYNIFDIAENTTFTFWIEAIKAGSASSKVGPDSATAGTLTADSIPWTDVTTRNIGIVQSGDSLTLTGLDTDLSTATGQSIAESGIDEGITTTSGGITFNEGGSIKSTGKDSEADTTAGFFLGYNGSNYTLGVGDANNSLTWNGSSLSVTGAVNATSGDFSGQVAVGSTAGSITVIDGNDTDYRLFTNATLDTDTNQYLPDDSSFKVGNDGRVFASNITIYNDDGDVLLSPTGLGAAALNDISTTSGQVVSTVGGTVSNSTSEITLTTSSASESFTITSKVAINDNFDATQYFSGASTSSTASAEAQLTGVDVLIDYYVKADGGSYGASPDVTKTVTIVNSGTPTSTQMRVGGFDRGSSYSGSLTRYFALLQDFGGALEIIPNSGGGASSYVVTTASLGSSLFPSAQTYKIKIVMRVVEDGTTTVISGSTTPPSSNNTTTGIYFDGGNSDERHYEITGTGLIKNSDNNFTSGSQNLLSSGGTISGNLTVTGDFTVQGTTTTLDTATLNVEDKNITLNYSTGDSSGSADGAGITIQDAVNSSTDATLNWNATNDRWEFSHQMKTPSLMVGDKERIDSDGDLNNIRNINASGEIQNRGGAYLEIQSQQDGGADRGIYMWDYTDTNWVIYMGQAGSGKAADDGTAASGIDGRTSHAIRYRVADSASQIGHLFENSSDQALFQITGDNGDILSRGVYYPSNQNTNYVSSSRIQNWQTAYTYSQVGHLPLAGGTLTGTVTWTGMSESYVEHARNLNAIDDRDIAPEDLNYSQDLRFFFAEKNRVEGGTTGSTYLDFIYLNSYSDSSGGDANALAFHKGTQAIYHYQADQAATNWGTPKQLAYTDGNITGTSAGLSGSPNITVGTVTAGAASGGSGSLFKAAGAFSNDSTSLLGASNVPLVVQATDDDTTAFGMLNRYGYQNFALNVSGSGDSHTDRGSTDFFNRNNGNWTMFLRATNYKVDMTGPVEISNSSANGDGKIYINNGTNWGLMLRGVGNSPYVGAYYGGSINFVAANDSALTTLNATKGSGGLMMQIDNHLNIIRNYAPATMYQTLGVNRSTASDGPEIHVNTAAYNSSGSPSTRILNFWNTTGTEIHAGSTGLAIGTDNASTSQPTYVGVALFNDDNTNGSWSPMLQFGGRSPSDNYMNGTFALAVKNYGNTSDTNFAFGDLYFLSQRDDGAGRGMRTTAVLTNDGQFSLRSDLSEFFNSYKDGWNYMGFRDGDGNRKHYLGNDSGENFIIGSDVSSTWSFSGFTSGSIDGSVSIADELLISRTAIDTRKIVLYDAGAGNNYQFYGLGVESQSFINSVLGTSDTFYWYAGVNSASRQLAMSLTGTGNGYFAGSVQATGFLSTSNIDLRRNNDSDGAIIYDLNWLNSFAYGSDDRIALIRANNQDGASGQKGGSLTFYTRQANSGNFNAVTIDNTGSLAVGGLNVITGSRVLQNVTANGSIITSGSVPNANEAYALDIEDTRAARNTPADMPQYKVSAEFTSQIPTLGAWYSLLNVKGWHDGYTSWQLIGPSNTTSHEHIYLSTGVGDSNSNWSGPDEIYHEGMDGAGSGIDADNLDSYTWGNVGTFFSATAGSKIAVQNSQDGGSSKGIYLWNSTDTNWGIYMSTAGSGRSLSGGTASSGLDGRTSHAIRFRVADSTSQIGFLFENRSENALFQIVADTGAALARGNITAYASDERLKTNIKRIERPLEKLQQIRGVEFDWIDGIEETHQFYPKCKHETGVIAQDIEKVMPDAISPAPFNNEYKTVEHTKIISLLIESVKELSDQVKDLQAKLAEQDDEIHD